jgi:SAM-dependent methyltransferase
VVEQYVGFAVISGASYVIDTDLAPTQLSWRDPDGFVLNFNGRILRAVSPAKVGEIRELIKAPWMTKLAGEGFLPQTRELQEAPPIADANSWFWLEHDVLPFPCYPHEITALQLFDSADLTLKIAIEGAQNGWALKDASAWNVLHSEGRPVFVDLSSFVKDDNSGVWVAYGQFVRHFLLPLLIYRRMGIMPSDLFLTKREGLSPEQAYDLLPGLRRWSPTAIELVLLPKLLARAGNRAIAAQNSRKARTFDADMGSVLLLNTLRRLRRILGRLRPEESDSTGSVWERYEEQRDHYTDADLSVKTEFVARAIQSSQSILDLGCNAGEFSLLAAHAGKTVVSADADHPALSRLYARVRGQKLSVAPILLNIGRPTPAVGWLNKEIPGVLERSMDRFDCVLALGLIHHLLVSERAPLRMVVDFLALLNPKTVVLEWVDPLDPKFQQVAGLNRHLYQHLTSADLEASMGIKFRLADKLSLPCGTRVMYLWCQG